MLALQLHGYQLGSVIHTSATTLICGAVRESDGAKVILKLPQADHPSLGEVARARREHELLRALDSCEVVPALALEWLDHRPVLVTEDSNCVCLQEYFRSHARDVQTILPIAIGLARALVSIHAVGVIHKDIGPSNIVVERASGAVKLIDFGISTRLTREAQGIAHPGVLEGTLLYMSPEQTGRMNCALDARSDLYSAGATLYTLFAGKPPFESEDPVALVHAHIALEATPLSELVPGLPVALAQIVAKLMAKPLDARYQTARGLLKDLETVQAGLANASSFAPFTLGSGDVVARLDIPHTLYGRADETASLLAAFERVAHGSSELLLVGGYSGIGKSALVHEVQKPIMARRGYFASGKYDQYNRNVPYSAFSGALSELVHYLLMEPAASVAEWAETILAAVGDNARLLIDVVPALELLIGPQEAPPAVPQLEAKSRFESTFRAFIAVLAQAEHPLVLFLDDVQWADTPSLHLLEALLTRANEQALLVIAAYRDNEVNAAHPAMLMAEAIKQTSTPVAKLTLGPLALRDALALVTDALHVTSERAAPLAELLHGRTGGNPFFLVQLLQSLEHDGLLEVSADGVSWSLDLTRIRAHGLTDNVIELMAARLRKLPEATQQLLKLAACVGNTFDLELLSAAQSGEFEATELELWPALSEELVVPGEAMLRRATKRRSSYRFLHDRVQQAAYALLSDSERTATHHKLGWLLLRSLAADQLDSAIFDIVSHLNQALPLVSDPTEREQVARLNVRAGTRAQAASAHKAAAANFATAMQLLGPGVWDLDPELAYELHRARAECEYLSGNFAIADELAQHAYSRCSSTFDRARLYSIRILIYITQGKFAEATDAGLEVLRLFGYDVPADPQGAARAAAERAQQVQLAMQSIDGADIQALATRPAMHDPAKRALMQILIDVWCATFFSGNTAVNAYTVDSLLCLSLELGNTPESAFAYVMHGVMLTGAGNPRRGYEFGLMGMRTNQLFPNPVVTVRISNMFANSINPYFNHLETNLEHYKRSYEIGPRVGEIIYTVWAVNFLLLLKTMKGDPLNEVYDESLPYLDFIKQTNDQAILTAALMQLQMIRTLRGLTPGRNQLDEGEFSEAAALARHQETKFWPGILFYGAYRSGVHVVFRDFRAALSASRLSEEALASDMGFWTSTNHFFYQSLALAGVYFDTLEAERPALLQKLRANLSKLAGWAETGPVNFAHRRDLVAAELARCLGDGDQAARLYDASLAGAKAGRFNNDVAVAAEAAAHFHRGRGSALAAGTYLAEAHYAYTRWGADAKVAELLAVHPELAKTFQASNQGVADSVSTTSAAYGKAGALDFRTAMKAAQALSGEIDRHALIDKLLHIAMENAGAREAWLVLKEQDELCMVANAAVDGSARALASAVPVAQSRSLPVAIVQYVARTAAPVVLRDATREGRFRDEAQVVALGSKSVACVPLLRQRRLTGVLYLENKLAEGAFTNERVEMLQLIAAQAAISLENAALYANLEARVAERTQALDLQNARMRLVLDNVAQGFLLAEAGGALEGQHSRILGEWFGVPAAGKPVWDYLYPHDASSAGTMRVCWEMLNDGVFPIELCIEQLPARFSHAGRSYDTKFRPILNAAGTLERVLVVVSDISAELLAERAEAGKQELAELLDQALADRAGFKELMDEGRRLVAEINSDRDQVTTLRVIHTLKGNAAIWQLKSVAGACHQVENEQAKNGEPISATQRQLISATWQDATSKVEGLLSKDSDEIGVRNADYESLVEAVQARRPHPELESLLSGWTKEPLARRFGRFALTAKALAERLGKPGLRVNIETEDLRTVPGEFAELWGSFTHLIRNAIDHGIETPELRVAAGKTEHGRLTFRARALGESVVIEMADDGQGINWQALAKKARAADLPAETEQDLQAALFADGVSTRDQASEISGRGIGLAAVKAAALELGARIEVRSERGAGTCFAFHFPASAFQRPRMSRAPRSAARPSQPAPKA